MAKLTKITVEIEKFGKKGEKSGWVYAAINSEIANQLNPGVRKSFRVKGSMDGNSFARVALIPVGGGDFIFPLNAAMRKILGKKPGQKMELVLQIDKSPDILQEDFMICLKDDEDALEYFKSLTPSHQRYFSKWIEEAKTAETRERRIARSLSALSRKMGYGEMLRETKKGA